VIAGLVTGAGIGARLLFAVRAYSAVPSRSAAARLPCWAVNIASSRFGREVSDSGLRLNYRATRR
jgi:hypothetical protein